MQEQQEKMFTQTKLFEMGFTKGLINSLLPAPIEKPNPMYKKAAPMKLWYEKDVLKAMETDCFIKSFAKREKRKQSAKKAVETRTLNLSEYYNNYLGTLTVKAISDEELREKTIQAKRDWYNEEIYEWNVSKETMDRWVVNYIRHNLIEYDDAVYMLRGKTGKDRAYGIFKRGVLAKIAEAYPKYKEECQFQIECVQY